MGALAVTVVVTCRDQGALVPAAVEAVRAQSRADHAVFVMDDGSSDGTPDLLRERFASDPRLRVEAGPRRGTAAARNAALASIATTWTAFLEPEDRWAATYLESQLAVLASQPEADLVVAGCRYTGAGSGLYATTFDRPDWETPDSIERLCAGGFAYPSAVVVRTSVAQALPFDEALETASDLAWLFRVIDAGHRLVENRRTLVDYGARPSADRELADLEADEVRSGYADRCEACRRNPLDLVRRRARYLDRTGRRREARAWFWRWWKAKPDSTQALRGLLRCLLARK